MVDAHDHRDVLIFGRGGNDDFFGAGGQVAPGFGRVGEQAGAFDDQLGAQFFPGQARGVLGADHAHIAAVDGQNIVLRLVGRGWAGGDLAGKAPLGGIVFEEIGQIVRRNNIADGDDLHVGADHALLGDGAENQAADASEAVDCNFNCHNFNVFLNFPVVLTEVG